MLLDLDSLLVRNSRQRERLVGIAIERSRDPPSTTPRQLVVFLLLLALELLGYAAVRVREVEPEVAPSESSPVSRGEVERLAERERRDRERLWEVVGSDVSSPLGDPGGRPSVSASETSSVAPFGRTKARISVRVARLIV